MSRSDELPPDQRATLSLLLRRRKTYAEVAALLTIAERAVHDRAHAALAVLAPRQARALSAQEREEIGDYLLGQQTAVGERLNTRARLERSVPARLWAEALAAELAPLSDAPLPEIPGAGDPERSSRAVPEASGTFGASPPGQSPRGASDRAISERLPSSRVGGALLLGAIAVAVILAIVLGGGGKSPSTTSSATTTAAAAGPKVVAQLTMHSPDASSRTVGAVEVLTEGQKHAFLIDAENLPESKGFFYALWLYNSPTSARGLSAGPPVGASHRLQGGALLPSDAGSYHTILLTRETNRRATHPGPIVLSGPFRLG